MIQLVLDADNGTVRDEETACYGQNTNDDRELVVNLFPVLWLLTCKVRNGNNVALREQICIIVDEQN